MSLDWMICIYRNLYSVPSPPPLSLDLPVPYITLSPPSLPRLSTFYKSLSLCIVDYALFIPKFHMDRIFFSILLFRKMSIVFNMLIPYL